MTHIVAPIGVQQKLITFRYTYRSCLTTILSAAYEQQPGGDRKREASLLGSLHPH
jgi:hypothetical protein